MSALPVNRINGHGPLGETAPPSEILIPVPPPQRPLGTRQPAAPRGDLSRWLQMARGFMTDATGRPEVGELRVTLRNQAGDRVTYLLADAEPIQAEGAVAPALSPLEREIVRVTSDQWTTAKAIASRLRLPCDGCFRAILRNLTEREPPLLDVSKNGYRHHRA